MFVTKLKSAGGIFLSNSHNFHGNLNYYVMPKELWDKCKRHGRIVIAMSAKKPCELRAVNRKTYRNRKNGNDGLEKKAEKGKHDDIRLFCRQAYEGPGN